MSVGRGRTSTRSNSPRFDSQARQWLPPLVNDTDGDRVRAGESHVHFVHLAVFELDWQRLWTSAQWLQGMGAAETPIDIAAVRPGRQILEAVSAFLVGDRRAASVVRVAPAQHDCDA